jgi:hypothetical protein
MAFFRWRPFQGNAGNDNSEFRQTLTGVPSTTGHATRRAGSIPLELLLSEADPVLVEPIRIARSVVIAFEQLARSVVAATGADIGVDAELAVPMGVAGTVAVIGTRA